MLNLLRSISSLRLAPNSPETDISVEILKTQLPFRVYEFNPSEEVNGWVVPFSWCVKKAQIFKDGSLIYDGLKHPLGVMGYAK